MSASAIRFLCGVVIGWALTMLVLWLIARRNS